jgi:hypothetical protein
MLVARAVVNDSLRTDLCLYHPPHMIALAAIYIALNFSNREPPNQFKSLLEHPPERVNVLSALALYLTTFAVPADSGCDNRTTEPVRFLLATTCQHSRTSQEAIRLSQREQYSIQSIQLKTSILIGSICIQFQFSISSIQIPFDHFNWINHLHSNERSVPIPCKSLLIRSINSFESIQTCQDSGCVGIVWGQIARHTLRSSESLEKFLSRIGSFCVTI